MAKFISHFGEDNDANVDDRIFLARLRHWRDTELKATDWTQVSDAPVDQTAWATYRQALRDITTQENPREIVWATPVT